MKTVAKSVALLFLLGLLGGGCSTISDLSTEFEEEMTRIESLSPEEKAALDDEKKAEEKVDMKGYFDDG